MANLARGSHQFSGELTEKKISREMKERKKNRERKKTNSKFLHFDAR
jgi:hypothetical protein